MSVLQGYSWDLEDDAARELGLKSIVAAGHRDAYSGNSINLFTVREEGWEFQGNFDLSEMWYKYQDDKAVRVALRQKERDERLAAAPSPMQVV